MGIVKIQTPCKHSQMKRFPPSEKHFGTCSPMGISNLWDKSVCNKNRQKLCFQYAIGNCHGISKLSLHLQFKSMKERVYGQKNGWESN